MRSKTLCWIYGLIALGALVATWSQNIRFFGEEGNGGLSGFIDGMYENAAAARLSDMSGYAPLTEILAAVHTKAHVRLFMN